MSWPRGCLPLGIACIVLVGCERPGPGPFPTSPSAPPAHGPAEPTEPEPVPVRGPEEPPHPPPPLKPATPPPTEEEMRRMWESPEDEISDEDLAALRQEVQDHAGSPEAHYRLGQALQRRGQRAEAVAEFREALRLAPRHAGAQAALRSLQGTEQSR